MTADQDAAAKAWQAGEPLIVEDTTDYRVLVEGIDLPGFAGEDKAKVLAGVEALPADTRAETWVVEQHTVVTWALVRAPIMEEQSGLTPGGSCRG